MAIDMTPEQKETGKANFERVVGGLANADEDTRKKEDGKKDPNRREFMKGLIAASAVVPVSAAAYYGYTERKLDKPVKVGLIGAGDEGGVLTGFHNPNYTEIVAVCDIRPYNMERIFRGEQKGPRLGLERIYGKEQCKSIKKYDNYKDLLKDDEIEAVIIALPLNLHAPVTIEALKAKKHVLCEKLMAWNVRQCKEMIQAAEDNDRVLSIGHQRHYSLLYAHCVDVIRSGVLGQISHIRALWHRNNTKPFSASDPKYLLYALAKDTQKYPLPKYNDGWQPAFLQLDVEALGKKEPKEWEAYGFDSLEQLIRWRLYNKTGGGLMAELGSHQLDACSIFIGRGIHNKDEAVHPLSVSGNGYKLFYRDNREVDDSVFVTFEFPGKNYPLADNAGKDKDDKVVVTYSSINSNSFEPYGECVMGSLGSLVTQTEQDVMLYPEAGRSTAVGVRTAGGAPTLEASASTGGPAVKAVATGQAALGAGGGPPSRGYREEMEHFAFCIRNWGEKGNKDRPQPRCDGRHAMADAIMALSSNLAMKLGVRIDFTEGNRSKWFEARENEGYNLDDVPENDPVLKPLLEKKS